MPGDADRPKPNLTKEEREARRAARGGGKPGAGKPVEGRPVNADGVVMRPSILRPRDGSERPPNPRKVFVIGFQKTGTTTLTMALRALGFTVAHPSQTVNLALKGKDLPKDEADRTVRDIVFDFADKTDAAQDSPVFLLFRELDERFPGSKFVYTAREPDKWIGSAVNHFGERPNAMHAWMYGVPFPKGHEDAWLARFTAHREEVREYFADRPDDLLTMDLARGDGWHKLVTFLGPELMPPFPHGNKRR